MFSRIRRNLTYANVVITAMLVFAMTGGAYAASKYLITSINQISPQALDQLSGKFDSSKTTGKTLHSGQSEIGVWGLTAHTVGLIRQPFSFSIPLAVPTEQDNVRAIKPGQEGKEYAKECPGTVKKPAAMAGYMCLYSLRLEVPFLGDGEPQTGGIVLAFYLPNETENIGPYGLSDEGTWAVTAA